MGTAACGSRPRACTARAAGRRESTRTETQRGSRRFKFWAQRGLGGRGWGECLRDTDTGSKDCAWAQVPRVCSGDPGKATGRRGLGFGRHRPGHVRGVLSLGVGVPGRWPCAEVGALWEGACGPGAGRGRLSRTPNTHTLLSTTTEAREPEKGGPSGGFPGMAPPAGPRPQGEEAIPETRRFTFLEAGHHPVRPGWGRKLAGCPPGQHRPRRPAGPAASQTQTGTFAQLPAASGRPSQVRTDGEQQPDRISASWAWVGHWTGRTPPRPPPKGPEMTSCGCPWVATSARQLPAPWAGATPPSQSVSLMASTPGSQLCSHRQRPLPGPLPIEGGGGRTRPDRQGSAHRGSPVLRGIRQAGETPARVRVSHSRTGNPGLPICTPGCSHAAHEGW